MGSHGDNDLGGLGADHAYRGAVGDAGAELPGKAVESKCEFGCDCDVGRGRQMARAWTECTIRSSRGAKAPKNA